MKRMINKADRDWLTENKELIVQDKTENATEIVNNLYVDGDITASKVTTGELKLNGDNNVITFQSSALAGNSKIHDETLNKDTQMLNLLDGRRVIVHNLKITFNTDANNTYPDNSKLGFQVNSSSSSGYANISELNNHGNSLYANIPAWFDFGDPTKPIPGILVSADWRTTGTINFCYYDATAGAYTVLALSGGNIKSISNVNVAQV